MRCSPSATRATGSLTAVLPTRACAVSMPRSSPAAPPPRRNACRPRKSRRLPRSCVVRRFAGAASGLCLFHDRFGQGPAGAARGMGRLDHARRQECASGQRVPHRHAARFRRRAFRRHRQLRLGPRSGEAVRRHRCRSRRRGGLAPLLCPWRKADHVAGTAGPTRPFPANFRCASTRTSCAVQALGRKTRHACS